MMNDKLDGAIIAPSGKIRYHDGDYELKSLQKIVGGLIEILPLKENGYSMVIDEEGKLKDYVSNPKATELVELSAGDVVVGTVLVCKSERIK